MILVKALYDQENPNYPSYVYLLAPISLAVLNPIAYVLLEIGKFNGETNSNNESKNINESPVHGKPLPLL